MFVATISAKYLYKMFYLRSKFRQALVWPLCNALDKGQVFKELGTHWVKSMDASWLNPAFPLITQRLSR